MFIFTIAAIFALQAPASCLGAVCGSGGRCKTGGGGRQDLDSGHHGSGFPLPPFRAALLRAHLAAQDRTKPKPPAAVPPSPAAAVKEPTNGVAPDVGTLSSTSKHRHERSRLAISCQTCHQPLAA